MRRRSGNTDDEFAGRYLALWGVALTRLLIPYTFPLPFNMATAMEITTGININGAFLPAAGNSEIPDAGTGFPFVWPDAFIEGIRILWLMGAGLVLLAFLIRNIRYYQTVRDALPVKDDEEIARQLKCRKTLFQVGVLMSDRLPTPVSYGLIHPKIVLPKRLVCSGDPSLRFVLAHEMTHIRRLDVLWKSIALLAVCVHWFNPLVWLMAALFNRDLEIACDESVISLYGKSAKEDYAVTLIDLSEQKAEKFHLCSAFGEGHTKERVSSIMKWKRKPVIAILAEVVLVAGAAVFFVSSNMGRSLVVGEYTKVIPDFSNNSAYAMGVNPYGQPVFKNTDKALKQAMIDYADGFLAVQEQYHLKPVSKSYWKVYKVYGWQVSPGNSAAADQGRKITGFFDIYENSFTNE